MDNNNNGVSKGIAFTANAFMFSTICVISLITGVFKQDVNIIYLSMGAFVVMSISLILALINQGDGHNSILLMILEILVISPFVILVFVISFIFTFLRHIYVDFIRR